MFVNFHEASVSLESRAGFSAGQTQTVSRLVAKFVEHP